jgi:hypothetical protein
MNMREGMKAMRRLPLFPLIPLLPIAMATGCIAMNIASYRRLRRLEQRLGEAQLPDAARVALGERAVAAPH